MVDFVLEQLGTVSFHFDLGPFPFEVLIPDSDPIGSGHSNQQIRKGEAVVPDFEILIAYIDDLWINQRPRLTHIDIYHAHGRSDLRRRDASSARKSGLPIPKRLAHVVHNHSDSGGSGTRNGLAPGAEDRVAQEAYAVNGHGLRTIRVGLEKYGARTADEPEAH